MNKKIIIIIAAIILTITLASSASAVIFNVTGARQKEWERYKEYKADYIQYNDLEGYEDYIYEPNLINNFGFRPASYYYISPQVLQAKYNPPLQGETYYSENRGRDSSLNHASAIQYYGEKVNGRYTGYIPSEVKGEYFDHPEMYDTYENQYGAATYGYPCNNGEAYTNAYYARISENVGNGFYVVGFY